MKSLVIPFICVILLCSVWFISSEYTTDTTAELISQLSDIYDDTQTGNWESVEDGFHDFQKNWTKYSSIYTYYINSSDLDRTDRAVAMCEGYLSSQNSGLMCGQITKIIRMLKQIELYNHPSLDTIF